MLCTCQLWLAFNDSIMELVRLEKIIESNCKPITLPRHPLNHVPGCCVYYVCSTCNRDVSHFST